MNYPVYDLHLNSLIKGYFSMYFKNTFLKKKYISPSKKLKSLNKILVSKAEIKHTNSKAIVTVYVYNREKILLKRRFNVFRKYLLLFKFYKKKIFSFLFLTEGLNGAVYSIKNTFFSSKKIRDSFIKNIGNIMNRNHKRFFYIRKSKKFSYVSRKLRKLRLSLNKYLRIIRNYKLKLSLNNYKF